MGTTHDTPLLARTIKRVRKGLYRIELWHPSGRKFEDELFEAATVKRARERCRLLYPSTVFVPSGKRGYKLVAAYRDAAIAARITPGE